MYKHLFFLRRLLLGIVTAGMFACGKAVAAAPATVADPLDRPAVMVRVPGNAYLTGLAQAGKRLVGVGERGIIVLSDDGGTTWRQAKSPTSVTLAAVQFPTPTQGWAVGHYGVILHSADGGESWTRQLDGMQAAQLALADAQSRSAPGDDGRYLAEAKRLVADGADKPFLGVHFADARNGFAVGAYNLAFRTRDGGKTWQPWLSRLDNARGNHLYAVQAARNAVYIAGEQGVLLRSLDDGERFERLDTGYKGSFFALAVRGAEVVLAGLRGNAFRSADRGDTWEKLVVPVPVSITALGRRLDGTLLLANQAGQLLATTGSTAAMVPLPTGGLPPLNDIVVQPDGSIVAASMFGAIRLPALPPTKPTPPTPSHSIAAK
ncbi:YCF48-related protein [Massilia sp. METH4]|uniref:WD40/YVTN/BNR-like repeat-containing protein n=1 Tax=Massilia sp. METH4 TaxID=3123041 RepID=UPI0030D42A62